MMRTGSAATAWSRVNRKRTVRTVTISNSVSIATRAVESTRTSRPAITGPTTSRRAIAPISGRFIPSQHLIIPKPARAAMIHGSAAIAMQNSGAKTSRCNRTGGHGRTSLRDQADPPIQRLQRHSVGPAIPEDCSRSTCGPRTMPGKRAGTSRHARPATATARYA